MKTTNTSCRRRWRWDRVQSWINDRIIEVRRQRGACPGLGAALTAFGMPLGEIVAAALTSDIRDEEDPWLRVQRCFANPKELPAPLRSQVTVSLQAKWRNLSKLRCAYLRLISRLALTADQAAMLWQEEQRTTTGIRAQEIELLSNPYLICEQWTQPAARITTWTDEEGNEEETTTVIPPPAFWTVDRAVYLPSSLAKHHPLPGPDPGWESDDSRRVRALLGHVLRAGEREGQRLAHRPTVWSSCRSAFKRRVARMSLSSM